MTETVDFYFFFKSPYSYLAFSQIGKVSEGLGVSFSLHPFKPEVLWPSVGNEPQTRKCPPKFANAMEDIQRWVGRYQIPFTLNSALDNIDGTALASGIFTAADPLVYAASVFDALWAHPKDLSDADVLHALCLDAGQNDSAAADIAGGMIDQTPLDKTTEAAIEAGVFGAPSFIYDGKLFFGNDRLDFLIEAIKENRH